MADNPQKYVKIEAVIKPFKLDDVKDALVAIGVPGVTVIGDSNETKGIVRGRGLQRAHTELYRGSEYTIDLIPKTVVWVVVPEELSDRVADVILQAAKTGIVGDGLVWAYNLNSVRQIVDGQPYQP